MELKPAYKQTEVGIIPEDWEVKKLKQILFLKSGYAFSSEYYSNKGPILLTPGNFKLNGGLYFNERNTKRYSGTYSSSAKFEYGDLLVVMTDLTPDCKLLGKPAFVYLHEPILHNQRIGKIDLLNKQVIPEFLYWYFLSDYHCSRMKATATGSTVRHTSNGSIYNGFIALPPPPEQRTIASALSDTDALLSSLDSLLTKKRDIKQAVMQQLLTGKQRLPGFGGEWNLKEVKDLVQVPVTDGPHTTPQFQDAGIPFLSVNNIVDNRINFDDLRYISLSDHELFSKKCKPMKNDILLGKAASVGKVALVELEAEFNIWSPIALLRISARYSPKFFYYLFQSSEVIKQITLLTNSSSQGNLGMGDIEKIELYFPSHSEQTAIAAVLSDMDAEIDVLQQRRNKTRVIKQGMMQELLTGRTRLV